MPELRRILVVALDNLGDLVFASALVPPIRQAFPSAVIGVWCKEYTAPIARLIPHVDQVFAADPMWAVSSGRPRPPLGPFVRTLLDVRHAKFDLSLIHISEPTRLLSISYAVFCLKKKKTKS